VRLWIFSCHGVLVIVNGNLFEINAESQTQRVGSVFGLTRILERDKDGNGMRAADTAERDSREDLGDRNVDCSEAAD
jgi:hypothetical protein